MEANSLQSLLRCSSTIYAPGTGLPITWELTNVGRAPTHLFRDWFDATSFRELPRHPLSGFSLTILRSNGEVLPDFVQTGGAIGEAGPLQPVHLYRLNPGETYEITIDAFHFTVFSPDRSYLWTTHSYYLPDPQGGEVLRIQVHYTNRIKSPSSDLDIWTGSIDSNVIEVSVVA
jgi:hypothetical protein